MAIKDGTLTRDPCLGVEIPTARKRKMSLPSRAMLNEILALAQQEKGIVGTALPLLLTTGMRRGELLGLQWSDIDWERKALTVNRSVNYQDGMGLIATETKTEESGREILLTSVGREALHRQREKWERKRLMGSVWQENDLVFFSRSGRHVAPSALNRAIDEFLDKHSFPHIRVHDTRHAAATILLSLGVPINKVQEFLGHADARTTIGVYGHVLEEDNYLARQVMEQAYAPSQQNKR